MQRGQIVRPSLVYDSYPRYVTDDPSPAKFVSLLKRVDLGELSDLCLLQQEMERKSDHFAGVVQTRRNAITGLEWCVEPDPKADEGDQQAQEVADYVSDRLTGIAAWPMALTHLSEAIGPNLAVLELIWEKAELADFVIVPSTRLVSHPFSNMGVAIKTDDQPLGIGTEEFLDKFVVHIPNTKGGFPFRTTLTHASVVSYLMLHFSRSDWLAFSELYGTPWRIGFYEDSVVDADRITAQDLLNEMGTDVAAMLPKGIKPELFQASGTGETYSKQCDYADAKLAILWLGQTLTTDVGDSGSRALGDVHDKVRRDLRTADLMAEAATIEQQIIRPMVRLKFPGDDVPIPTFRRKVYEPRDVDAERLSLEQLAFAANQGLTVNTAWLYDTLHIPKPMAQAIPETIVLGQTEKPKPEESDDGSPE